MIDEQTLLAIWQNAIEIIPDGDNSVFFGVFERPTDAPAGVNAVMTFWTQLIDTALHETGVSDMQRLELLGMRGFTYDEYTTLFDNIKEPDYLRYPIYQSLLITTAAERASVIYQLMKDSYEDYLTLLARTLRLCNPLLYNFLYDTHITRTIEEKQP